MKKLFLYFTLLFVGFNISSAQIDTLRLSTAFTTHLILNTDIVYYDVSNKSIVRANIIEQNRNMISMKALKSFEEATSLSVLDSGGNMLTYIVVYDPSPAVLVVDTRKDTAGNTGSATEGEAVKGKGKRSSGVVSQWKKGEAPSLKDVLEHNQQLFHIGKREYDIEVSCENIWFYNDITYMELSLKNNSGISYEINDATFVIESKKTGKRTVNYDLPISHKNSFGSLTAAPGAKSNIVYSFDKLTLANSQVLRVYFYETNGQRNLVMTIDAKDINKAYTLPLN